MIFDQLGNSNLYPFGPSWTRAFDFLRGLDPAAPAGRYDFAGADIFALVMGYATRPPEAGLLEAHRDYVDIQMVLAGREGCECFPLAGLVPDCPYDPAKDVQFFRRPAAGPARLELQPGLFVALFPADAHLLSVQLGDQPEAVHKVVVKVRRDLLLP